MADTLRELIGKAIIARFEASYRRHGANYDPDTAWEAADDVVAALVGVLTNQECTVRRNSRIIGTLGFVLEEPKE